MAYPIPNWDDITKVVDKRFVFALRKQLTATSLFTSTFKVPDLGVKTVEWKEASEMEGAVISMEIPELSAQSAPGYTDKSVQLPVITKDLHYDYRDYLAFRRAGVDTMAARELAWAMAKEINTYLYKGNANGPGPATGLLNHSDILTYNNSANSNWTVANDMVMDLNDAIASKLLDKEHKGPYVMLMNPRDSDLFGAFVTNTSVQAREKLPSLIRGVMYDKEVASSTCFLVEPGGENFDLVTASDVGDVIRMRREDPITRSLDLRWMTAMAPRIRRPDSILKITFDRA